MYVYCLCNTTTNRETDCRRFTNLNHELKFKIKLYLYKKIQKQSGINII